MLDPDTAGAEGTVRLREQRPVRGVVQEDEMLVGEDELDLSQCICLLYTSPSPRDED